VLILEHVLWWFLESTFWPKCTVWGSAGSVLHAYHLSSSSNDYLSTIQFPQTRTGTRTLCTTPTSRQQPRKRGADPEWFQAIRKLNPLPPGFLQGTHSDRSHTKPFGVLVELLKVQETMHEDHRSSLEVMQVRLRMYSRPVHYTSDKRVSARVIWG